MPGLEIVGVLLITGFAWLWLDSLKAREAAIHAARAACAGEGLMLLDDAVAISSLKPARDEEGRIKLQRAYNFEYSDTGNNRLKGSLVMLGHRMVILNLGLSLAPTGRTLH